MGFNDTLIRLRHPLAVAATTAFLSIGLGTLVGLALPQYSISQKGREFHPDEITIKRGETIQIVNDDADLIHHAYIDSPSFHSIPATSNQAVKPISPLRWLAT